MKRVLVVHGPNLNLLGNRDTRIYGRKTLEELNTLLGEFGKNRGVQISTVQSNLEGEIINHLQSAAETYQGIVFNPGGYTHTSVAIRDAVEAVPIPVIEVHLSNILSREEFRHVSLIAPVCQGSIMGFGPSSYLLGVQALIHLFQQ